MKRTGQLLTATVTLGKILANRNGKHFTIPRCETPEGLETAKANYARIMPAAWSFMQGLYNAKAYTPERIKGPAAIVFPNHHLASADPLLLGGLESYVAPVFKTDRAVPSRAAKLIGGIEMGPQNLHAVRQYAEFLLEQGETIAIFTFLDVNGPRYNGLLRQIMKSNGQKELNVAYHAADIVWQRQGKEVAAFSKSRFPRTKWPLWWVNSATLLVSPNPRRHSGSITDKKSIDDFVDKLQADIHEMRAAYGFPSNLTDVNTAAGQAADYAI